jgi:hypothetical protein
LIDDGFVDKEKINGSNYFWSFPAKKDFLMQIQHQQMLESNQQLKLQADDAEAKLNDAKRGREETGDRAAKLQRLNEMAAETKVLEEELEALKENDPQALADLEHELKLVTQAAHRWTDNLFNCKSYLVTKRGMDKKEANKIIGIPASFDCKLRYKLCSWMDRMYVSFCFQTSCENFISYF